LGELHRTFNHIQHSDLPYVRNKIRECSDFEEHRIRYILKQISQKELGQIVFRRDNLRKKYTELVHIYELIHATSVDLFIWINDYVFNTMTLNHSHANAYETINVIQEKINDIEPLRIYINDQLAKISISYNNKVPQFAPNSWKASNEKFSLSKAKKNAAAK